MNAQSLLVDYARYNLWANTEMVNFAATFEESLLKTHVPSSFPSFEKTLLHIWDAEIIWLNRLQGHSPSAFPSQTWVGDFANLAEGLLKTSRDFIDFILERELSFFHAEFSFTDTKGTAYAMLPFDMIFHCLNHSTFHRGQCVTLARNLALTNIPWTDYIRYVRLGRPV